MPKHRKYVNPRYILLLLDAGLTDTESAQRVGLSLRSYQARKAEALEGRRAAALAQLARLGEGNQASDRTLASIFGWYDRDGVLPPGLALSVPAEDLTPGELQLIDRLDRLLVLMSAAPAAYGQALSGTTSSEDPDSAGLRSRVRMLP